MLYLFFSTIFIIPTLLGWGKISEFFWGRGLEGLTGKLISGVAILTLIWTLFAFFFPMSISLEIVCLLIGISAFFFFKLYLDFADFLGKNIKLFCLFLIVIIFFASSYPVVLDHFGYYVPTIKWLTEYGLVKGISNLDLTLGQMSLWHIFQAGFSHFSDPFLRINSVLLTIYLIFILEKKSWIQLLFLPVLIFFGKSPNTDIPALVFSLIIIWEILNQNKNIGVLFALSAFTFAIKPTMIWLPMLVFLYGILFLKSNFKVFLAGIGILLLFTFKNIWCFGYPIFPVQIGDLGLSWRPNQEVLKRSSEMAILKTYDLQYSIEEIENFSKWDYIKNWFLLDGVKSKIHWFFLFSWIVFITFAMRKKSKLITLIAITLLIKSILIVAFSAQYRFFLDVFFVMFFVMFYPIFDKKRTLFFCSGLMMMAMLINFFPQIVQKTIPSFRLGSIMKGFEKSQLYEPSVYTYEKYHTYKIGNLQFNVVKDYPFSFNTPIPAISPEFLRQDYEANIFPQKVSNKMKDGFVWRKITNEEKQKLKLILQENKIPTSE